MEVINVTNEMRDNTNVSQLLAGTISLLPPDMQTKVLEQRQQTAEGTVIEATLSIGGVQVPLAQYSEALLGQVERMAEERAKELIEERVGASMDVLEGIQTRMQMMLTTDLTCREQDRWMLEEFGK